MCIILTESHPESTHLFNIPCTLNSIDYQMLIYTNDLPLRSKYELLDNPNIGLKVPSYDVNDLNINYQKYQYMDIHNDYERRGNSLNSNNGLMIVVIPKINSNCEFGLVDITTDDIKYFRKHVSETCKTKLRDILINTMNNTFGHMDGYMKGIKKLKIHNIGNYDISIANDLKELKNNIDWEHFTLPNDFKTRIDTFSDKTLFPNDYSYVVAKTSKDIKNDGFGILFPDPGYTYFPTCHENSNDDNIKLYDVRCYDFSNKAITQFSFKSYDKACYSSRGGHINIERIDENYIPAYPLNINEFEKDILNKLPPYCISSKTGEKLDIKLKEITHVNFCPIKTKGINQNIELVNPNPQTSSISNVITGVYNYGCIIC